MWLLRQVAQIVVKAAWARIPPIDDFVEPFGAFWFRSGLANFAELLFQPESIVQREIDRVEIRAASDRDGLIFFDAQLHADALKQSFPQLEDARADILRDALCYGAVQNPFSFVHRGQGSGAPRVAQSFESLFFEAGFVKQSAAHISVVVGSLERLLKTPIG